ncbi:MAG: glutathione S-transferase [Myxococcota bacterium]
MDTIVVHHLEESRSLRILWLLEELDLPYDVQLYRRHPKTMRAPPELKAIHPLGRAPVVVFGDRVLAESGAITEFFVERFAPERLCPIAPSEREQYRFWMHYAEGSLMPPLLIKLLMSRVRSAKLPFFIKPIARRVADTLDQNYTDPELENHFDFIEGALESHPWLAGPSFSAADIQMSFPLQAGAERGRAGEGRPNIRAWIERIAARPAYQRAVARDRDALASAASA